MLKFCFFNNALKNSEFLSLKFAVILNAVQKQNFAMIKCTKDDVLVKSDSIVLPAGQFIYDTHSSLSTDFSSATKFRGINPSASDERCRTRHQSDSLQYTY